MIEIKFLKEITILSSTFKIKWDKTNNGGQFSLSRSEIVVGISCYKNDPSYTFSILTHELMEVILLSMGCRFDNSRTNDNYLFNFDHQTFENAIQIFAQTISQFIK